MKYPEQLDLWFYNKVTRGNIKFLNSSVLLNCLFYYSLGHDIP